MFKRNNTVQSCVGSPRSVVRCSLSGDILFTEPCGLPEAALGHMRLFHRLWSLQKPCEGTPHSHMIFRDSEVKQEHNPLTEFLEAPEAIESKPYSHMASAASENYPEVRPILTWFLSPGGCVRAWHSQKTSGGSGRLTQAHPILPVPHSLCENKVCFWE